MNTPKKKPDLSLESIVTNKWIVLGTILCCIVSIIEGWIPLTSEQRSRVFTTSIIVISICALVFFIRRNPFKIDSLSLRNHLKYLRSTKRVLTGLITLVAISLFLGLTFLGSLLYSGEVNPWISSHLEKCVNTTNPQSLSSSVSLLSYYDGTPGVITPPGGLSGGLHGGDYSGYDDSYKCVTVGITPLAGFTASILRFGYLILCLVIIFLFYVVICQINWLQHIFHDLLS